ncbi:double zinc ribbon domain-containing protein [Rhodopila sp.]|uniref:double zinc ribbon domain-containing protein n=1 Tax=Rhodopila sp. TaxID=2480087 RepID=UPI003D12E1C5
MAALDALLPPRCVVCDTLVGIHGQLCGACFAGASFITAPFCARCGVPFASVDQAGMDGLCTACRDHPPVFRQARAALRYNDMARRLILPFKHADRVELGPILAPLMLRAGGELLAAAQILVPVPLHRRRLYQRKYNQAAVLAQAVGRLSHRPALLNALVRTRPTVPLDDKTAAERARAVAGCFAVRPSRQPRLVGRSVLLIDDVMTSGATTSACAAALLVAGAVVVDVLVAARVPDPRLG